MADKLQFDLLDACLPYQCLILMITQTDAIKEKV